MLRAVEGQRGSRWGTALSWMNETDLEQEEEFESGFGGCGKDQMKLMPGMPARDTETGSFVQG